MNWKPRFRRVPSMPVGWRRTPPCSGTGLHHVLSRSASLPWILVISSELGCDYTECNAHGGQNPQRHQACTRAYCCVQTILTPAGDPVAGNAVNRNTRLSNRQVQAPFNALSIARFRRRSGRLDSRKQTVSVFTGYS